ncbi:hypothetical protein [Corynebacterium pygosceleis]|uniref:Secreted protein n=1 Tax=Corynebacterium pygosceleis TaxID=2800406 RepID=A0A9Q4CA40_9CORY|nr:hypothetical protein [Corynebacterium pygosceleis]MCK7637259.1 hypothetical protein [Corynebacterium pygosceleis]MCK7676196.1 hypothetical protein [Corynebacterium pygosceleis]MCL0119966.1 hypothetical protein [Corynebacterium pygosceleis]MCX7445162.1 hypothetical protein [Corynebacterium pygosceleis]MCX7468413.1 hypothetical protein [Corynebacterium pygosceleis]
MKLRRIIATTVAACAISTAVAAPATANPIAALSAQSSSPSGATPAPGSPEAQVRALLGSIFFLLTGGIFGSSGVILR